MFKRILCAVLLALPALPVLAQADNGEGVEIKEWKVPWPDTRPRDPYVAPDGRVWFCGQDGGYLAVFDPGQESFTKYDIGEEAGPHNLIVHPDGSIWYAGNKRSHIGRLVPESGTLQTYSTPEEHASDPHTLVWTSDYKIWFTSQWSNSIGRLDPETQQIALLKVPTDKARPYGIVLDRGDRPWVALHGTNKLATIDSEEMDLREIELKRKGARPRRIGITDDGRIWYVDYAKGYLGAYDPISENFEEWRTPGADNSGPYGLAVDADNRIWFVETWQDPNRLVGFNPATRNFFSIKAIPGGAGAVRNIHYDERADVLWFGTDANTLARVELPE